MILIINYMMDAIIVSINVIKIVNIVNLDNVYSVKLAFPWRDINVYQYVEMVIWLVMNNVMMVINIKKMAVFNVFIHVNHNV
jgi:hypothetical protein